MNINGLLVRLRLEFKSYVDSLIELLREGGYVPSRLARVRVPVFTDPHQIILRRGSHR